MCKIVILATQPVPKAAAAVEPRPVLIPVFTLPLAKSPNVQIIEKHHHVLAVNKLVLK